MSDYQRPMPPPRPDYPPPVPPVRRDNQVASTVFAVIISLLVLPVIVVCAVVSMSQAGFPFGMSLLFSTVGGVVATGFLIPEVYGWMRRNI